MNYIEIGFYLSLTFGLLYTSLGLITAIHFNFQRGTDLRNQYTQRVRLLPTNKMLRLRKFDLNQLLHNLPVTEIERVIRNCETCIEGKDCQTILKTNAEQDFSFCPNDPLFSKIKEEFKS